jgi:hypothetical protein
MVMKNFKINKNQQPLSDADIARGKDFGKLVQAYKAAKVPFYKSPKLWMGASSVLVASVAAVFIFSKISSADQTSHPFISPPVASADIQSTVYVLNAQADSTINYPGGSKIHVPANAFLDKNGKIVTGKVDLHYREFKKVDEVFLAGIPMTYDSAGEQFHFETAGMMEITASQNGEGLKTNPAALVKIDMVSANKEDRFNTYYLDTIEKKWKYTTQCNFNNANVADSNSAPATSPLPVKEIKQIQNEIVQLEKQKPNKPKKQDTGKPRFSIKVDPSEFPEIAIYKGVKFQVEDSSYRPDKADITWADIELKRLPGNNRYQITFINPNEKYRVIAVPVFDNKDYAAATKIYGQKFETYEAALNKKKAGEAALAAKLKAKEEAPKSENDKITAAQKRANDQWAQAELVYRSFQVSDFGYWNSDHPCRLPAGNNMVKLNLTDAKTGQHLNISVCYLVEKERNALFAYGPKGLERFRFDAGKENGVWVMTTDNRLGVAKYSDFKSATTKGGEMELQLTMMNKTLKTTQEVKQYLEL